MRITITTRNDSLAVVWYTYVAAVLVLCLLVGPVVLALT